MTQQDARVAEQPRLGARVGFRVRTADLVAALAHVRLVTPRKVNPRGSGYLFVVGNDRCEIHSSDGEGRQARASFEVTNVVGEGSFVYPADRVEALLKDKSEWRSFEAQADEDGRFTVRSTSSSGGTAEYTTFDPRLLASWTEGLDVEGVVHEFPSAILKEALGLARPFLPEPNDRWAEPYSKLAQLFDGARPEWAKGDGHLFAADSVRAYYFWCDAFWGKGFHVPATALAALIKFLGRSGERVTIKIGPTWTVAMDDEGRSLVWLNAPATHSAFKYYALKNDKTVVTIDRKAITDALKQMRSVLDRNRDKIQIRFDHRAMQLGFAIIEGEVRAESEPVLVKAKDVEGVPQIEDRDWAFNVNLDHLIDLVKDVKNPEVELRVLIVPPTSDRKEVGMFRTIDDFRLDARGKLTTKADRSFSCRVTRFMPSKE